MYEPKPKGVLAWRWDVDFVLDTLHQWQFGWGPKQMTQE